MSPGSTITMSVHAELDRVCDSYQLFMKKEVINIRLYTRTKTKTDLEVFVYSFVESCTVQNIVS